MVQGIRLFFALFNNLAIFIALVAIYRYLLVQLDRPRRYHGQVIVGLVFGLFAIATMQAQIPVFEGVIVDQRNAIVALSGAFGGPASALASAVVAGGFRAYLGGGGVPAGLIGIGLSACAGMILHRFPMRFASLRHSAASALFATVVILPGFLFVGNLETGWALLQRMTLPYGGAVFIGILLVGLLLQREEDRYRMRLTLRESEEKYRVLFESFPLGVMISDAEGRIIETNGVAQQLPELTESRAMNRAIHEVDGTFVGADGTALSPEERPGVRALRERRRVANTEVGVVRDGSDPVWLNVTAAPIPLDGYGIALTYIDVSDRKRAENDLKNALDEKTSLLQELYHRTKNNMQVIISLLDMQSASIEDPKLTGIVKDTQNRIRSMALVHDRLYQSRNLSRINLSAYIRDLVIWLEEDYHDSERVDIVWSLEDVWTLIDTAIPCGLIIEELVSNALKHAFPNGRRGTLEIGVERISETGEVRLRVADDGVGVPKGVDIESRGKVGLQVVAALGRTQLEGDVSVATEAGVEWTIRFDDGRYTQRV